MNLPFVVWTHDGPAPEVLARVESMGAGRRAWANSKHAAISSGGELLDTRSSTSDDKARAMERAAAAAWRAERGLAEPTPERRPFRLDEPTPLANGTLVARRVAPATKAPPPTRPARPAAVAAAPAAPPVAAAPRQPPMPDESAELQLVRARAVEAEAKVAQLQRLLSQVTGERDAHRDRAEADAHRIEQLRGEAEGLTTDLGVVRHDLARAIDRSGEMAADLGAETDDALALLDLAMTTGLAVADEARAEADRVARHAGELSRQLGAVRDELAALRERPAATPALDEDVLAGLLARVAAQAARQAVRATREDLRLRALAATVPGGIDELERLALGYTNLLRQTGHA